MSNKVKYFVIIKFNLIICNRINKTLNTEGIVEIESFWDFCFIFLFRNCSRFEMNCALISNHILIHFKLAMDAVRENPAPDKALPGN